MTQRLYYRDCYLTAFDATITDVREADGSWHTRLNRSAFYPTSGGQSHDRGLLGNETILDVFENDEGEVVHVTDKQPGRLGDTIHGEVDAAYRRVQRQKHTAQHIISNVAATDYDLVTVSVHLGDDYCAIELPAKEITDDTLRAIEDRANEIVLQNLPTTIHLVDAAEANKMPLRKPLRREGEVRILQIDDIEYSACGGTHVAATGEIGLIKLIGTEKLRGNSLIKFLPGALALDDYRTRFDVTDRLSRDLTCAVDDLPERFSKLSDQISELKRDLNAARKQLLPIRAEQMSHEIEHIGRLAFSFSRIDDDEAATLNQLAPMIADRTGGVAGLYAANRLVVATAPSSGVPAGELVRQLCAGMSLRGGGGERMGQVGGLDDADLDKTIALLKELLLRA